VNRMSLSQAYSLGLAEEMRRDPSIFVAGTDLFERGGHWAQVRGLGDEFGRERVYNTPISEAAIVAAGVGAAMAGLRPVIDLNFIDFSFGSMDEIVNQAAKVRYMWDVPVPLVIRGQFGTSGGGAQHSNLIESWFAHVPALLVATPSTPADAKGLIKASLRGSDPVIFLMHKSLTGTRGAVPDGDEIVPFGQAAIRRAGKDLTIVSYSWMATEAMRAAATLAEEDIYVEFIDLRTVFPLDLATIETSVRKTRRLIVATEAPRFGGIAAEISASIAEALRDQLAAPIVRVGGAHAPVPHSPALMHDFAPTQADVVSAALTLVGPRVG